MNGKGCGVGAVRPFPSPRRKRSGQGDCVVCGRAPLLRPPVPAFLLLRRGPRLAARSASTRGWPPARIAIAIPHLHNGGSSILGPRRQQEEEEVGGGGAQRPNGAGVQGRGGNGRVARVEFLEFGRRAWDCARGRGRGSLCPPRPRPPSRPPRRPGPPIAATADEEGDG